MSEIEINPISMLCVAEFDEGKESDSDVEIIEDNPTVTDVINQEIQEAVATILNVDKSVEHLSQDNARAPTASLVSQQMEEEDVMEISDNEETIPENVTADVPTVVDKDDSLQLRVDQVFSFPHAPLFDLMEPMHEFSETSTVVTSDKPIKLVNSNEEKAFRKRFCKDNPNVAKFRLHCTVCDVHLGTAGSNFLRVKLQRLLRVLLCCKCNEKRLNTTGKLSCYWCFTSVDYVMAYKKCSQCPAAFCKACIERNFGDAFYEDLEPQIWKCFFCVPQPIWPHRAIAWLLLKYLYQAKTKEFSHPENFLIDWTDCCINNPLAGIASTSQATQPQVKIKHIRPAPPPNNQPVNLQTFKILDVNNCPQQVIVQTNSEKNPANSITVQSPNGSFQFNPDKNHMFVQGNQPWTLNTGPQIIHNVYPQKKVVLIPIQPSSGQSIANNKGGAKIQNVVTQSADNLMNNVVLVKQNKTKESAVGKSQIMFTYNDKNQTFISACNTSGSVVRINDSLVQVPTTSSLPSNSNQRSLPIIIRNQQKNKSLDLMSDHNYYLKIIDNKSSNQSASQSVNSSPTPGVIYKGYIKATEKVPKITKVLTNNSASVTSKPSATQTSSEHPRSNILHTLLKDPLENETNQESSVDKSAEDAIILIDDEPETSESNNTAERNKVTEINIAQIINTNFRSIVGDSKTNGSNAERSRATEIDNVQIINENFQTNAQPSVMVQTQMEPPRPKIKIKAIEDLIDKKLMPSNMNNKEQKSGMQVTPPKIIEGQTLANKCFVNRVMPPETDKQEQTSVNNHKVENALTQIVEKKTQNSVEIDCVVIPEDDVNMKSLKRPSESPQLTPVVDKKSQNSTDNDCIVIPDHDVVNMKSLKRAIDGVQRVLISVIKSVRESRSSVKGFPNMQCSSDTAATLVSSLQTDLKMCVRQLNVIQSNVYEYYKNVPGIIEPPGLEESDKEINSSMNKNSATVSCNTTVSTSGTNVGKEKLNYMDDFTRFLSSYKDDQGSSGLGKQTNLNVELAESYLSPKRPRIDSDSSKSSIPASPVTNENVYTNRRTRTISNTRKSYKKNTSVKSSWSKYHALIKKYNIKDCFVRLYKLDPAFIRVYQNL